MFGIVCSAFAQKIMIFKGDGFSRLIMKSGRIKDSVQLDHALLSVKYRFSKTGEHTDSLGAWCDILLQIGEKTVKQTDLCLYFDNLIYTTRQIGGSLSVKRQSIGSRPSNLFVEMFCDRQTKNLSIICGDFFNSNAFKQYSQSLPVIQWKLSPERKEIDGYMCNKAVADFGGRTWIVWYTTEIPLSFGPWKLNGLPGLILDASDKDFSFKCIGLYPDNSPIMEYTYDSVQDLGTLERYLRYEQNCYVHPYQAFANGEDAMIMFAGDDGKMVKLGDSWTIPYNPIERE